MHYYEIIPAERNFHGKGALTYSSRKNLVRGQLVRIRLRNDDQNGIVMDEVAKPEFDTSEVAEVLQGLIIPEPQIRLVKWMLDFYPGSTGATAQLFAPGFVQRLNGEKNRTEDTARPALPELNTEQSAAYKDILSKDKGSFIVHGVTGSGKTRLYMKLVAESLSKNRSAVILTPEISLTAPIASQFKQSFGSSVEVNHSSLTPKQKSELWQKAFGSKKPLVIIGPRSSLFLPLADIGLIVVDEFHEPAYKQQSKPYYHANRVASMLASLSGSRLVFGSATPPISDYYLASQKKAPLIKLELSAITGSKPVEISEVVNLLDPDESSGYPLISRSLISQIKKVLARNEQAMLFINKRGSARSISCQECGQRELCPNCDLPMIYHADQHLIRCHTCGSSRKPPVNCPSCGSSDIYFSSPGTKAVADNLAKLFPGARIARFDRDNNKAERMENNYDQIVDEIDIIVGTQTIAKGHDLPRLSLVAMLLAENSLDFPDYSSEERSYQLIRQLSGRINRGHRKGIFILQTFDPDSRLIKTALGGSWEDFYKKELEQRRQHGFPPFYSALKIESSLKSRSSAQSALNKLIDKLGLDDSRFDLLGPVPSFVEKKSSKWHWQVIIKARNRSDLAHVASLVPSSFKVDIDPNNFL